MPNKFKLCDIFGPLYNYNYTEDGIYCVSLLYSVFIFGSEDEEYEDDRDLLTIRCYLSIIISYYYYCLINDYFLKVFQ